MLSLPFHLDDNVRKLLVKCLYFIHVEVLYLNSTIQRVQMTLLLPSGFYYRAITMPNLVNVVIGHVTLT